MTIQIGAIAPEIEASEWLRSREPLTLAALRGRVVMIEAFQMLCPGCVSHALPQAQRVAALFRPEEVAVIGLHSVFEHHDGQGPVSLRAFIHEYRIGFPVAIDQHAPNNPLPITMARYGMRGTPTLILIDRKGIIRHHGFGAIDDLALGAKLAMLVAEAGDVACDETGCLVRTDSASGSELL
jgi:peroxiredoxin